VAGVKKSGASCLDAIETMREAARAVEPRRAGARAELEANGLRTITGFYGKRAVQFALIHLEDGNGTR